MNKNQLNNKAIVIPYVIFAVLLFFLTTPQTIKAYTRVEYIRSDDVAWTSDGYTVNSVYGNTAESKYHFYSEPFQIDDIVSLWGCTYNTSFGQILLENETTGEKFTIANSSNGKAGNTLNVSNLTGLYRIYWTTEAQYTYWSQVKATIEKEDETYFKSHDIKILYNSGLQAVDGTFNSANDDVYINPGQGFETIYWYVRGGEYDSTNGQSIIDHRATTLNIYSSPDKQTWTTVLSKKSNDYSSSPSNGSFVPDNSLYYKISSTEPLDANRDRSGSVSSYSGDFRTHTWGYYNEAGVALVYAKMAETPYFSGLQARSDLTVVILD